MGRANPKLVIWIHAQWNGRPEIEALRAAGHTVVVGITEENTATAPDLILHPAAHAWHDALWDYLPAALAAARKRRKETR